MNGGGGERGRTMHDDGLAAVDVRVDGGSVGRGEDSVHLHGAELFNRAPDKEVLIDVAAVGIKPVVKALWVDRLSVQRGVKVEERHGGARHGTSSLADRQLACPQLVTSPPRIALFQQSVVCTNHHHHIHHHQSRSGEQKRRGCGEVGGG